MICHAFTSVMTKALLNTSYLLCVPYLTSHAIKQPKNLIPSLHLIRAGLVSGLLTKKEIISWADKIIIQELEPDIFFIELSLQNSKETGAILHYINDYLNFDDPFIEGRPLLGLLYKEYKSGRLNLEQTVITLYRLKYEVVLTNREESYIYSIDNDYECASQNIYGTLNEVQNELDNFLGIYKEYSFENFEDWEKLGKIADVTLEQNYQQQKVKTKIAKPGIVIQKPWWKFW